MWHLPRLPALLAGDRWIIKMWAPKVKKIAELMHVQYEWWVHHKTTKEVRKFDDLPDADKLAYKMVAERILREVEDKKTD